MPKTESTTKRKTKSGLKMTFAERIVNITAILEASMQVIREANITTVFTVLILEMNKI